MLIPLDYLSTNYGLDITGVLHVGAHLGEEADDYDAVGARNVWWVEGDPGTAVSLSERLRGRSGHSVIGALVSEETRDRVTFHRANNGQSSSLLRLGTHRTAHPEIHFVEDVVLPTVTVDALVDQQGVWGVNFLNLDIQGAELLALRGAERLLRHVDYIYTEVNDREVYEGCVLIGDLDAHLAERGFVRIETAWASDFGWGDAFYVRRASAPAMKIISVGRHAGPYLPRHIASIEAQDYPADLIDVVIVDDASEDPYIEGLLIEAGRRNGWKIRFNSEHLGALRNQTEAIDRICTDPDDVIVFLDSDDRFATPDALSHVAKAYADPRVQVTYGNYRAVPPNAACLPVSEFPEEVIKRGTYRQWSGTGGQAWNHLRTIKYRIFSAIPTDDLKLPDGTWNDYATDSAMMYPALELAGPGGHRMIPTVLVEYTSDNPIACWRTSPSSIDYGVFHVLNNLSPHQPLGAK